MEAKAINLISTSQIRHAELGAEIVKQLYRSGCLAANALAKLTGKSVPLVTQVFVDLTAARLVVNSGLSESTGGRRAQRYTLRSDAFHMVTVIIDVGEIRLQVLNSHNHIVLRLIEQYGLANCHSLEKSLLELVSSCQITLINNACRVSGLSIAAMEFYDVIESNLFWNQLIKKLNNNIDWPVYISSNTFILTLYEQNFGVLKGKSNALILNYDFEIGLGMIINDQLVNPYSGFCGATHNSPKQETVVTLFSTNRKVNWKDFNGRTTVELPANLTSETAKIALAFEFTPDK